MAMTTTEQRTGGDGGGDLSGSITIDGSSTVGPFTEAAAEAFQGENPDVKVTVGTSGTGGGFEKFCAGETDISDASRADRARRGGAAARRTASTYERGPGRQRRHRRGRQPRERLGRLPDDRQLKKIWDQGSKVNNWNQVDRASRTQSWSCSAPAPTRARSTSSPTQINGEEGASREDYSPSEDDNVTVQGVSGDKGGLGYFGLSYYEQNEDKLNLVEVDGGDGCVEPSTETVQDGSYKPLSRPLFIYPSEKSLDAGPRSRRSWTT